MKELDDVTLLNAIAKQRDRDALNQLYQRYEKRAFNLALHILGTSALADDAVQEAMLSIWLSPKQDLPQDRVSEWILGVVAGKSLNLKRGQRRHNKRAEHVAMESESPPINIDEKVENTELISQLRNHLKQLPELDSQLLACSYGAGMSHRKIAEVFNMSRTRVTERIQEALSRLRGNLTRAGVTAVVPVISAQSLFEAMTSGHDSPPGMGARMLSRIDHAGSLTRAHAHHAATAKSGASAWVAIAVSATVLTGATIVWRSRSNSSTVNTLTPPAVTHAAVVKIPGLVAHWTFNERKGLVVADSSGFENNGRINGGLDWEDGKFGGGLQLNYVDDYVDYGTQSILNFAENAPFTYAGWVKTKNEWGPIIAQRNNSDGESAILIAVGFNGHTLDDGKLMALVRQDRRPDTGPMGEAAEICGGAVNDGQWHHFALTRDLNGAIELFLDGKSQGRNSTKHSAGPITTNMRAIGKDLHWEMNNFREPDKRRLNALLDDIRIYSRVLSAEEIRMLMDSEEH
jgi:RNA polymerase sigma-70 factor (ECF subfamily)